MQGVHIPGLLSVNADMYELSKEVFMSALFSTVVYLQYSQHACCISGNCGMGEGLSNREFPTSGTT